MILFFLSYLIITAAAKAVSKWVSMALRAGLIVAGILSALLIGARTMFFRIAVDFYVKRKSPKVNILKETHHHADIEQQTITRMSDNKPKKKKTVLRFYPPLCDDILYIIGGFVIEKRYDDMKYRILEVHNSLPIVQIWHLPWYSLSIHEKKSQKPF